MEKQKNSNRELYNEWLNKIKDSEKKYEPYYNLVEEIREYYRNERKANKQNIFWSSIETLKPFLYFKQPIPFIIRTDKRADEVENLACKMLEKALNWNMKQFDFDSVIKYARNDFLLSGMGVLWEQYMPTFKSIGDIFVKDKEQVDTIYISPISFLADTQRVDVWEDVEWIARKTCMTVEEAFSYFGVNAPLLEKLAATPDKTIVVYEIWDKKTRRVYYLSPQCPGNFLQVYEDTLHLSGFFPCPKPIMATLTNDGIIPIPDYVEIKSMLEELDGINNRMRLIMQAVKISGCYDNSFPELANILDKDVTLISVSDFEKLTEAGGLKGIVDFMPIEQYIVALQALAERRTVLMNSIYEVTGVSDIMRGTSNARETATAVTQKTNFGTLRNQDRQNDMQRFLKDLLRIKSEIICEQFSKETLISFLTPEDAKNTQLVEKAVKLLKTEKLRGMVIELETDGSFNQTEDEERVLKVLNNINEMINLAFNVVSKQPALLPLYRRMIESAVASMPNARQFETVIEEAFRKIETEFNTPDVPPTPQSNPVVELENKKAEQDFVIKKEQNQIKREELELKKAAQLTKDLKDK